MQEALTLAREQLQATPPPARSDAAAVQERMRRLGRLYADGLVRQGTVQERRAVLSEIVDELYVIPGRIAAIRPTALYEPLVQAAQISVMHGGH